MINMESTYKKLFVEFLDGGMDAFLDESRSHVVHSVSSSQYKTKEYLVL